MLIFRDFHVTTTVAIPVNTLVKEFLQNRFGYVQIKPNFACNRFGFEWDWFLADVVQIKKAAVCQVFGIR